MSIRLIILGSLTFLFGLLSAGYALSDTPKDTLPVGTVRSVSIETSDPDNAFPIDLNSASEEDLIRLPGIGPVRAQAILDYRERNGFFLTTREIQNVYGIGEGIYDDIADLVTAEQPVILNTSPILAT